MPRHKAIMTQRRKQLLYLLAKGYTREQIEKELDLTTSNYKMQKWRLFCYLGVHSVIDAIIAGIEQGLLSTKDLSEKVKEDIYDRKRKEETK